MSSSIPKTEQQMELFSFLIKASQSMGHARQKLAEVLPKENWQELDRVIDDAKRILTKFSSPKYFKSKTIHQVLQQTNRNSLMISKPNFQIKLPYEIIYKIINFLHINEDRDRKPLGIIRLVSRTWYHVATEILLSNLCLSYEKDILKPSKVLSGLALQKLVLEFVPKIFTAAISSDILIASISPFLGSSLRSLLLRFSVENKTAQSDMELLEQITKSCPNIRNLHLNEFKYGGGPYVPERVERLFRQLEKLTLQYCSGNISALVEKLEFPHLRTLKVYLSNRDADTGLFELAKKLASLEELHFHGTINLYVNNALSSFFQRNISLWKVVIQDPSNDGSPIDLDLLSSLKQLKFLDIRSNASLSSPESIKFIMQMNLSYLYLHQEVNRSLDYDDLITLRGDKLLGFGVSFTNDSIIRLLSSYCKNLKHLRLDRIRAGINLSKFQDLLQICKNLKHIEIIPEANSRIEMIVRELGAMVGVRVSKAILY